MRKSFASLMLLIASALPAAAQGNWQQPREFQKPRDVWQTPGEIQKPGEIQVPKGIQAIKPVESGACERRLSVVGDALFDFDKSSLRVDAEETLLATIPEIRKLGGKAARVEGHTDAIGSDGYNQKLSEARAKTVRDWLAQRDAILPATAITGYGKTRPVAANTTEDGKDFPEGRQQNRRVEVVFDTCK